MGYRLPVFYSYRCSDCRRFKTPASRYHFTAPERDVAGRNGSWGGRLVRQSFRRGPVQRCGDAATAASYSLTLSEQVRMRYRMMARGAEENEAPEWSSEGIQEGARIAGVGCGPRSCIATVG